MFFFFEIAILGGRFYGQRLVTFQYPVIAQRFGITGSCQVSTRVEVVLQRTKKLRIPTCTLCNVIVDEIQKVDGDIFRGTYDCGVQIATRTPSLTPRASVAFITLTTTFAFRTDFASFAPSTFRSGLTILTSFPPFPVFAGDDDACGASTAGLRDIVHFSTDDTSQPHQYQQQT